MLKNTKSKDVNWIEQSIAEGHIKYFEDSNIENKQLITSGSSGSVYRFNWKNTSAILVLKTFNNNNQMSTFINEVWYTKSLRTLYL
jgi:hypothetical protein